MRQSLAWVMGFGGIIVLAVSEVGARGPIHAVARDMDCVAAALWPVVEIDFEGLPFDGSSCPGHRRQQPLPNPLEMSGVLFSGSSCLQASFCSVPTCIWDPDNAHGGNVVLILDRGSTVDFPPETGAVVLGIQGIGDESFSVRATDVSGDSTDATAEGVHFGAVALVFTSDVGLARLEILPGGGTGGPLVLAELLLSTKSLSEPPRGCDHPTPEDLSHLRARVSGTASFLPELGILARAPVGADIQSTYSRTTDENREIRRGFFEFLVPDTQGEILNARLFIQENRAVIDRSTRIDLHEVSYYPADLQVDAEDFERQTMSLAIFATEESLPPATFSFDVSRQVQSFRGKALGFRIKLSVDPDYNAFDSLGSGFGSTGGEAPWLEIQTASVSTFRRGDPDADGTQGLSDAIKILSFLFAGGKEKLACEDSADLDDSGVVNLTDAVYLLHQLFRGGPDPADPYASCGADSVADGLSCAAFPQCT